jgi:hypothetical protein
MLLHPKRAVLPLTQGRWRPFAAPSTTTAHARSIRTSPPNDAEEVDFSGNDVRSLSYAHGESQALKLPLE